MKFNCPNSKCNQPLEVDDKEFAGIEFNCPRCGQLLEIESPAELAPSPTTAHTVGYFEVKDELGHSLFFESYKEVRTALLAGNISRKNAYREHPEKPDINSFFGRTNEEKVDAYLKAERDWQKKSQWRTIGSDLAKTCYEIQELYEPFKASVKGTAVLVAGVFIIIGAIVGAIISIVRVFKSHGEITSAPHSPGRIHSPGVVGGNLMIFALSNPLIGAIFAIFAYGVMGAFVGWAIGYPIGACSGIAVYFYRRDKIPRIVDDGYRGG